MNDEERGERLESWKKIAAYLRRDVRTVQRWEQANGLPVHRHQRAQRPIPYAYAQELDAWWKSHSQLAETAPPARRLAPALYIYVSAGVVVLVAALAFLLGWTPRNDTGAPRSVAVLPFVDLSEDMANEEFADGITEELIARLNRIPDLHVTVGKSPGVAFDLDGSARRSGDRVRVVARLVRTDDGAVVWSETYERAWADIIVVQDEIVGEVVRSLEKVLAGG